jgi:hypothetical protein
MRIAESLYMSGLISYPRDRLAAYLAWGGSSGVQLLFLIATVTIAFTRA